MHNKDRNKTVPSAFVARQSLVLAAAMLATPAWGTGMEPVHGGHDHHAHHHHMAMAKSAGATRSLASYSVPDVTLMNQQGERVSLRGLLDSDRPVLLNFIYTSCTAICPVLSASFARVQQGLGEASSRVRMVSVSIDPEYDTPVRLARYAERFDAGPQWQFLTGALEDSVAVQEAFDTYRGDKMNHAPLTLMRSAPDAQWVRYDGFADTADLVREARAMIAH